MTTRAKDARQWRDFAHTVSVLTANALAAHERTASGAPAALPAPRFEFEVLAAAEEADAKLPGTEFLARGSALGATIEERPGELWINLQLKGFAALSEAAGREARLVSANGAIDYRFRFSDRGTAVCVVADTRQVREGLKHFSVAVDGEEAEQD